MSLLLIIGGSTLAFNKITNANVTLVGDAKGIVFLDNEEYFLVAENIMPGEQVQGNIKLENKYDYPYELYIRSERITPIDKHDLLEKLTLTINMENDIIYEGNITGSNGLEKNKLICEIMPNEVLNLNAVVTLDGKSTGNEYKGKVASIRWIFTAIRKENINDPQVPGESPNPNESLNTGSHDKNNYLPQTGRSGVIIELLIVIILVFLGIRVLAYKSR